MNTALIDIGLPVFNGEKYILEAIESILSQTLKEFRLIICDNASIDNTQNICKSYEKKDSRIVYIRNKKNYGAAYNYNKTVQLATSKYFKWAAHDDILHKEFLEKCINKLESDNTISLCYPKTYKIDGTGIIVGDYSIPILWNSQSPVRRFKEAILVPHSCVSVFGVFKLNCLLQTNLIGPFYGSDRCLLAEIALKGKIYELGEYLFYRRDHEEASVRKYTIRHRNEWFDTNKLGNKTFLHWEIFLSLLRNVIGATLGWTNKLQCFIVILHWFKNEFRALCSDIKIFVLKY